MRTHVTWDVTCFLLCYVSDNLFPNLRQEVLKGAVRLTGVSLFLLVYNRRTILRIVRKAWFIYPLTIPKRERENRVGKFCQIFSFMIQPSVFRRYDISNTVKLFGSVVYKISESMTSFFCCSMYFLHFLRVLFVNRALNLHYTCSRKHCRLVSCILCSSKFGLHYSADQSQ